MKVTFILVVFFVALASSQEDANISSEGIFGHLWGLDKIGLKTFLKLVNNDIIRRAKYIFTDGLRVSPTKEVKEALMDEAPSTEGIFEVAGNLLDKKAYHLSMQYAMNYNRPSSELISQIDVRKMIKIFENYIHADYNNTIKYRGPSFEGIHSGLGGFVIRGLGDLIGGQYGNIIRESGDVVGNLFYVVPKYPISQEGIIPEQPSEEGIISSVGKLIARGSGKLAKEVLQGAFNVMPDVYENILLSRGHFSTYPNIKSPGYEILLEARHKVHANQQPEVRECVKTTDYNLTKAFNRYVELSQRCVATGKDIMKNIFYPVQDIVLDSVRRVEETQRQIGYCFDKYVQKNKMSCLEEFIPNLVEEHIKNIKDYRPLLTGHLEELNDLNSKFDMCLTELLGRIRVAIGEILQDFDQCQVYSMWHPGAGLRIDAP